MATEAYLFGPSQPVNTGIAIFEAASDRDAQQIVAGEPVTSGGHMRGDLRPFRLGLLRRRDNSQADGRQT